METERDETFQRLLRDPNNFFCYDCQAESPLYASVSHGIFICSDCVDVHRSLGVHISFVKGLMDQNWTQKQLRIMAVGGNTRFREYMGRYVFPSGDNGRVYRSKAAKAYRDRLKQLAEGSEWLDMDFSPSEGVQEYIETPPVYVPKAQESLWKGFFSSAVNKTRQLGSEIADRTSEMISAASVEDITAKTKSVLSTLSSKGKEIAASERVQSMKTSASDYMEAAKDKASEVYDRVSGSALVQNTKASLLMRFSTSAPEESERKDNQV